MFRCKIRPRWAKDDRFSKVCPKLARKGYLHQTGNPLQLGNVSTGIQTPNTTFQHILMCFRWPLSLFSPSLPSAFTSSTHPGMILIFWLINKLGFSFLPIPNQIHNLVLIHTTSRRSQDCIFPDPAMTEWSNVSRGTRIDCSKSTWPSTSSSWFTNLLKSNF